MSLTERFKRLPEEQQLRNEESARQAREASELLKRLSKTRQEAERLAKEEIERTRKIQREEIEMHPEVVELRKQLKNAEREKEIFDRKQRDLDRSYQIELDGLKRDEANLLNRLNAVQEEEMKALQEQNNYINEREGKERSFKDLEYQLNNLRAEEEVQFINDIEVIKRQIRELEGKQPSSDYESTKNQLNQIENEIRSLQDTIEYSLNERTKFSERERKAADDLLNAQRLLKDAKNIEEAKKLELEFKRETYNVGGGFENVQGEFGEAEHHLKEIEKARDNLKRKYETLNNSIEEKASKVKRIREEIERLQNELINTEMAQHEEYDKLYDVETQLNRHEIELKDAKEHLNNIKNTRDFYLDERSKIKEEIDKLEQEIRVTQNARKEAEIEEKRAADICGEIEKRCNELESTVRMKKESVENLNQKALELQGMLGDFDRLKSEIDGKREILKTVQMQWTDWKVKRLGPIQQEADNLKSWLSTHPKIEPSSFMSRSTSIKSEFERVQNRIKELRNHYPITTPNFENPENIKIRLNAKEEEIKNRLSSHDFPASQRYLKQLEREAEALMRAQIAATHEKKQEAIEKDANELSKLRLSLKPQVELDEEAKNRLWRLNQETGETGAIAEQVFELCRSRNITITENE